MASKLKNSIIFIVIGGILVLGYIFFFKGEEEVPNLIPAGSAPAGALNEALQGGSAGGVPASAAGGDFLALLLNVRNIKLNDAIFLDPAFKSLSDSSIVLVQDGKEGRPNPFAPFGDDVLEPEEEEEGGTAALSGEEAGPGAPPSALTPEKEAIIAAIMNRQKILSSGNVSQIRSYLKATAPTPQDALKIDKESDKNILAAAQLVASTLPSITAEKLRSPGVEWTISDKTATLKLKTTDKGVTTTITISATKAGGQWY